MNEINSDDWGAKDFCDAINQSLKHFVANPKNKGNLAQIKKNLHQELRQCTTRSVFLEFLSQRVDVLLHADSSAFDLMWMRIVNDKHEWKKYKALINYSVTTF